MVTRVLPLLDRLHGCGTGRDTAGNRTLFFDDYAKLVLVYLLNPLIDSISMLQRAAALPKLAKQLGVEPFSKASFSEAPAVFDPALMAAIVRELAADARTLPADPRPADVRGGHQAGRRHPAGGVAQAGRHPLPAQPRRVTVQRVPRPRHPGPADRIRLWRQLGFATDEDVLARVEKTRRDQAEAQAKKIGA